MIKILLVDDDRTNSLLLKQILEVEDFKVHYAENGTIGWEMFNTTNPDLVLLDINMPELNGFELAQKIRAINSSVVIFFLSDRTEKKRPFAWFFASWQRLYSKTVLSRRTCC